jgi:hypothetical protein
MKHHHLTIGVAGALLPAAFALGAVTATRLVIQGKPVSQRVILHEGRPYVAVEDVAQYLGGEVRVGSQTGGGRTVEIVMPGKTAGTSGALLTERWAEPTKTERWSEAPKTEQWAEITKTERWSEPTYTQRRDSMEPVILGPAKSVDSRLVGSWKLWIPGGFSPDPSKPGQPRTQSFTSGAGMGTLTLASNGQYTWTNGKTSAKGQARLAKPWFAQEGLTYLLVSNGKSEYLVTYDPKNKGGFSLINPTGGYLAGGTKGK